MKRQVERRLSEDGRTVTLDGQVYRVVGSRSYVTRDGRTVELAVWQSVCATCGKQFEVTTVNPPRLDNLPRRCKPHRNPRYTVRQERRARVHRKL
jgi:hypothetical protein